MFRSARIKLTLWYLLIIMIISAIFSLIIYRSITFELNRFANKQRVFFQRPLNHLDPSPGIKVRIAPPLNPELIEESERRVAYSLVIINIGIVSISGIIGYFLAGRTLKPIHTMVEEQKRFITDASHELRTPLTALKSSIEVHLRDKALTTAAAREVLKSNLEDVNNLQTLSDNLLQLAQYQDPKLHISPEKTSTDEVVSSAMKRIKPIADEKHMTIEKKGKAYTFEVDPKAISNLLVILLENAVKYSPAKSNIEVLVASTDGNINLSVRDEGIGIPAKDLPYIFDRFYRSDKSRSKEQTNGYGLGLSIARRIVLSHGGSIKVKRRASKGTEFIITLPTQFHFS